MKKLLTVLFVFFSIFALNVGQSSATLMLLDDFTLKVGTEYIDKIDKLVYTGYSHVDISDDDGSGGVSVGDTFTDAVVFSITAGSLHNDSTGNITTYRSGNTINTNDFELTAVISLTGHHTAVSGDDVDYVFDTAAYSFYLDVTPDATPGMAGGTVSGYKAEPSGATLIATYVLGTGGGNFDFGDGDGNIDISFTSTMTAVGYMFDEFGNDFNTYGTLLAALTDSNSDETTLAMPTNWTPYTGQTIGTDSYDLNLDIDGSQRYGVPEPATMFLLGSGLIGLAGFGRKKKFFKKN